MTTAPDTSLNTSLDTSIGHLNRLRDFRLD